MDAAVAGLLGALVGGLATLVGSWLSGRQQATHDQRRWIRDRKTEAYGNAQRALLRLLFPFSEVIAENGELRALVTREGAGRFFEDLGDAQYWLGQATAVCGTSQSVRLRSASDRLAAAVYEASGGDVGRLLGQERRALLLEIHAVVLECGREDLRSREVL